MSRTFHNYSRLLAVAKHRNRTSAFTLIEMLVVIAVIGILTALVLPALGGAKAKARKVECANHLRQLSIALAIHADDNEGEFPPRARSNGYWIVKLQPVYVNEKLLKCPADDASNNRTYIMNGFDDWFESMLNASDYQEFLDWRWPHGMKASEIRYPTDTISFGEKFTWSNDIHMDFAQGVGNDIEEVDQRRHGNGSNFAFADGSVRFLSYWSSLAPLNLWAVTDAWRNMLLRDPRD